MCRCHGLVGSFRQNDVNEKKISFGITKVYKNREEKTRGEIRNMKK